MIRPTVAELARVRFHRHDLDRAGSASADGPALLDLGIQDSGRDGPAWALAVRGHDTGLAGMVLAWTLSGAPHAYRASDVAAVALATAPFSEADAAKRLSPATSTPVNRCRTPHATPRRCVRPLPPGRRGGRAPDRAPACSPRARGAA